MLITFSAKRCHSVTMFGDIATQLIAMMGFCETIPGAIREEDIDQALRNLQQRIEQVKQANQQGGVEPQNPLDLDLDADEFEPEICLSVRALPLISLLESACNEKSYVMWK